MATSKYELPQVIQLSQLSSPKSINTHICKYCYFVSVSVLKYVKSYLYMIHLLLSRRETIVFPNISVIIRSIPSP